MSCSGFLIQRLGIHLREEAISDMYVDVHHRNRTLLQRDPSRHTTSARRCVLVVFSSSRRITL